MSIWLIVFIATERYYGIINPMAQISSRKVNSLVLFAAFCSIVSLLPEIFYADAVNQQCMMFWPNWALAYAYYSLHLIFTAILPILLVIFLYTRILKTLNEAIVNN